MTNLVKYIEDEGPMLSGDLAKYLVLTQKVSIDAARKKVERLTSPIHKLKGLFSDNQSFVYHQSKFQSAEYFEALVEALKTSGKRYYVLISIIKYHNGIISLEQLINYSFSPTTKIIGHALFSGIVKKALETNLIDYYGESQIILNKYIYGTEIKHSQYKAVEFSKKYTLNQFNQWAKKIGLVSYETGKYNSNVSGFNFSFTSPTYLNGVTRYDSKKIIPGFLIADILIGEQVKLENIEFFIQKLSIIKAISKQIRLVPIIIVENLEVEALNTLKSQGVIIGFVNELFGENYAVLLKNLISTLTNAGAVLKNDPDKFVELLSKVTKLVEGKTNNLRGDLFEFAVGYFYSQESRFIELGKIVTVYDPYEYREIDVFVENKDEVIIVECKGVNHKLDAIYIERYLKENIPIIKKWLKSSSYRERKFTFEVWAIGGFTDEAIQMLEEFKLKVKRIQFNYYGRNEIMTKTNALSSSRFKKILHEYFLKEI